MCGRYTLFVKPEVLQQRFRAHLDEHDREKLSPRYNIAPTQHVPIITSEYPRVISFAHWGLIPSWAKDESIGNKMINARAETITEKPSFRTLIKKRRCLILANGLYEWGQHSKPKQPYWIHLTQSQPFAFAGLWDEWKSPHTQQPLRSCTIITTIPNDKVESIHHRMAVILDPNAEEQWLDEYCPFDNVLSLLAPYPSDEITLDPVSTRVNSATFDDSSLLEGIANDTM